MDAVVVLFMPFVVVLPLMLRIASMHVEACVGASEILTHASKSSDELIHCIAEMTTDPQIRRLNRTLYVQTNLGILEF